MVLHSAVCNATAILSINQTLVNHCCHLVDMLKEKTFAVGSCIDDDNSRLGDSQ